jgi:hypothetical protein
MGNSLRLFGHDNIFFRGVPTVTSEVVGFEVRNLFDGNRHSFWKATSAVEQVITIDAGSGNTLTADAVALARADLLVAVGAQLSVQHSTDMSAWTDASGGGFPDTLAAGDLRQPGATDYYQEFTSDNKRGWRLRIHGTLTGAPMLAGLWLGRRLEVAKNPQYGRRYGVARAHRGADLELTYKRISEAQVVALMDYIKAVSPAFPSETPAMTRAGAVYGGLVHYLFDPIGAAVRLGESATPALLPVILMDPDTPEVVTYKNVHDLGPLKYRQVV